jgi:hypothetical protein
MAAFGRKEPQGRLERQGASLLQRRESREAGTETTGTTSEDGERRGKTAFLLRKNVWDAGANEGREGQAD